MLRNFDQITVEALLGRRPADILTAADRRSFAGQRVLITGAGGTVGAELARQIAACKPERLTLVDHSEYHLFTIECELADRRSGVRLDPALGDITRARPLQAAFAAARPDVVYHAAAYKHVTMTERAVCAAARVNVLGTVNALRAARDVGARFVLVSSDKAANPRSVMGATKRLAELAALVESRAAFRPSIVRFGNILGSSGSVVEVMLDRIRARRPLPITHPEATRYFMTASEAVALVIKADRLGCGGDVCWLDMGTPVRIVDLASRVLALASRLGLDPVPLEFVGLRPGEKVQEELSEQGVELRPTAEPRIWIARQRPHDPRLVRRALSRLRWSVVREDARAALFSLAEGVPEYEFSREAHAWAGADAGAALRPEAALQSA